jgi:hypothetical protein
MFSVLFFTSVDEESLRTTDLLSVGNDFWDWAEKKNELVFRDVDLQ